MVEREQNLESIGLGCSTILPLTGSVTCGGGRGSWGVERLLITQILGFFICQMGINILSACFEGLQSSSNDVRNIKEL